MSKKQGVKKKARKSEVKKGAIASPHAQGREDPLNAHKPTRTIDLVCKEFLDEQEMRLSSSSFSKYESIVDLLRSYLERYWPGHEQKEYDRITKAGGTFCGTFGPEEILGGLSEFLGYFVPHKGIAGRDTMKAAGTVTK